MQAARLEIGERHRAAVLLMRMVWAYLKTCAPLVLRSDMIEAAIRKRYAPNVQRPEKTRVTRVYPFLWMETMRFTTVTIADGKA